MSKINPAREVSALGLRIRVVTARHPFILGDPSFAWLVRSGTAEIFHSQVEDRSLVGRRRFLFRASPRDLLFTIVDAESESTSRLIALASEELDLLEIPLERVQDALLSQGIPFKSAIEGWVNNVSAFISTRVTRATAEQIPGSGELRSDAGLDLHPERGKVAWLRLNEGRALLMGIPELNIEPGEPCLPLGSDMWLRTAAPSKLSALTTEDVVAARELPAGLSLLQALLLKRIAVLDAEDSGKETLRLEERARMQQRLNRSALEAMASVLHPRTAPPARETALLSAVAAVGDALGMEIRPPLRSENPDRVKDPLEAIARASRLRHRRVLLRGAWWKSDCGPLVGYLKERLAPVALLKSGSSGYELFNPETSERVVVNYLTAGLLAPEAFMIYPSLPDDAKRPWHLVRFALRGRSADLFFIIGLSVISTLIGMLAPQTMAMVMDKAIPDSNKRLLMELGLTLVAASFGIGLFAFSRGLVIIRTAFAVDAATESGLWDKLLKLRATFYKRYSSGDLLSRVSAVSQINSVLNSAVLQSLMSSLMALLNLALLFYYSPKLALIALGMAVFTALATIIGGYFVRRYNLVLLELRGSFFGLVVQMVQAAGKIRVAGAEQRAFSLWLRKYCEQLKLVLKSQIAEDYVTALNQAIPTISSILLFWVALDLLTGAQPVTPPGQRMHVGIFLAFNTALATFIGGTTSLSNTVVEIMDCLAKSKRIEPILEGESEASIAKVDPGRLEGYVTLSHVDFRYAPDGPKILDDLSIDVKPADFVALVGPSGGGKSTIFRLLLGFETPDSGSVLFDGQDLAGLDVTAVRRQLGVVLQSGLLDSGSLFDNIAAGALVTIEEALEAAADAGLADDISEMPMGIHTVVSERGTNLSGGQRQRLLIARALVTQPRILLLDEATSALDNRTQAIVSASLKRRKVTRIVIAHRLSTVRTADLIYVLDHGRIVDKGTFGDLASRKGLFASMIARQMT